MPRQRLVGGPVGLPAMVGGSTEGVLRFCCHKTLDTLARPIGPKRKRGMEGIGEVFPPFLRGESQGFSRVISSGDTAAPTKTAMVRLGPKSLKVYTGVFLPTGLAESLGGG